MGDKIFTVEMLRQMLISSAIAWGLVEAIKPACKKFLPDVWSNAVIRFGAIAFGAASGYLIGGDVLHLMSGGAGGALSAVMVASLKAILRKRLGVEEEEK